MPNVTRPGNKSGRAPSSPYFPRTMVHGSPYFPGKLVRADDAEEDEDDEDDE
jgi:hypothetical protein